MHNTMMPTFELGCQGFSQKKHYVCAKREHIDFQSLKDLCKESCTLSDHGTIISELGNISKLIQNANQDLLEPKFRNEQSFLERACAQFATETQL